MDDFMDFLKQSQTEISYEEQLEQQKNWLLKQREVEDFKKITNETKKFCEQLKLEERRVLQEARETQKLCRKLDELKIGVQDIIDQNIAHTLTAIQDQSLLHYQKEAQREQKRQKIGVMKDQLQRYQEIKDHIEKSKGEFMLRQAKAELEAERSKYEKSRAEINAIWKVRRVREQREWKEITTMFVQIAELHVAIRAREKENATITENNDLMKAKIVRLKEEIEQKRIQDEEEMKRREAEMQERIMRPMKIVHAEIPPSSFKNPNDFPALAEKIEITRRSYENIFKRPEYVELRKHKRKNKSRAVTQLNFPSKLAPPNPINKFSVSEKTHNSQPTQVAKDCGQEEVSTKKEKSSAIIKPISTPTAKQVQFVTEMPEHSSKSLHSAKRKTADHNSSSKATLPTCHVQSSKRFKSSMSQPESINFGNIRTQDEQRSANKRRTSRETRHTPDQMPSTTKNQKTKFKHTLLDDKEPDVLNSQIASKEENSVTSQHQSNSQKMPLQETVIASCSGRQPEQQEKNQPSNPQSVPSDTGHEAKEINSPTLLQQADPASFDAVSLTSSTSSFDLENGETNSDFDFTLSPTCDASTRDPNNGQASDLDFDFLNSPPQQQQNSLKTSQRKQSEEFDFLSCDDSGTGFDFF
ncbi:interaptin-like isoform X2 [Malaya genurostris]|uniref:interaptin-like isoform X2 n=1 Tax=Malaya genurostris TaxID=325434 RepID=UPI0026F3C542|nr:interaptin-like isoform X2 [Malaya genurostris]